MTTLTLAPGAGKTEQLGLFPASDFCLRQTKRLASWRHTSEGGFNSRLYSVEAITAADADAFCDRHHYAGKAGSHLAQYGLYTSSDLVGVAVLTNASFAHVLRTAFPELEPYDESRELGRLVLLDEVPANAESWFLAEAFRRQAAAGVRGVVSFSDPVARRDAQGRITMPGHVGTIYQASNATYTGRVTERTVWHLPNGVIFNEQNIGKIRRQEQGHDYCEKTLQDFGATPKDSTETGREYWHRARAEARCYSTRHHGNHRYQFTLRPDRPGLSKRQERIARRTDKPVKIGGTVQSYPKKAAA